MKQVVNPSNVLNVICSTEIDKHTFLSVRNDKKELVGVIFYYTFSGKWSLYLNPSFNDLSRRSYSAMQLINVINDAEKQGYKVYTID